MKSGVLAKRYVDALYQSADNKHAEKLLQNIVDFSALVTLAEDAWKNLQGPLLSLDKKESLINVLAKKCGVADEGCHFLCLLARKDRLGLLPFIAKQAEQQISDLNKELFVVVDADSGFSSSDERSLVQLIEADSKKKVKLNVIRKDSSLGGFKAAVGHVVYDGTVENSIDTFKLSFN
jgi:F-type H+-transporting ATPase subunit delta